MGRSVHTSLLQRTLDLAEAGRGSVHPNPMVGAVVERGGTVIATGFHHRYGDRHAEAVALDSAGHAARGATLYCNLEPCSYSAANKHQPPCTTHIIDAGISRVVIGQVDPNPRVRGSGIAQLRAAGIEVVLAQDPASYWRFNASFNTTMATQRPFVELKFAMSLDGKLATETGHSQWISDEEGLTFAHQLRRNHDAVVVGVGTAITDDPLLSVRRVPGPSPRPVVLDSRLRLPPTSRLVRLRGTELIVITTDAAPTAARRRLERAGVTVMTLPTGHRVSIPEALDALWELGIRRVLVEGGGTVITAWLAAGTYDRVCAVVAPIVIGTGVAAIGDLGARTIHEAIHFDAVEWRRVGSQQVMRAFHPAWLARVQEDTHVHRLG